MDFVHVWLLKLDVRLLTAVVLKAVNACQLNGWQNGLVYLNDRIQLPTPVTFVNRPGLSMCVWRRTVEGTRPASPHTFSSQRSWPSSNWFRYFQKNVRQAVKRNRVRRIIRESFRLNQHDLPAVDIVILARKGLGEMENQDVHKLMKKCWSRLNSKSRKLKKTWFGP